MAQYDRGDIMNILRDTEYHSPEVSETDDENGKRKVNVYDLSWRSKEVIILFMQYSIKFIFLILITTLYS